jgi:dTDP-4-dehydrorhamnose 3,5-epimerase
MMNGNLSPHLQHHSAIPDVLIATLKPIGDPRGHFVESFRKSWFPWVNWDAFQTNCSVSAANVLRGLHYHHRQIDYWFVVEGTIRVGLADIRPASPTFKASAVVELTSEEPAGLFIPSGVAHGFYAVTPVRLTYIVNNFYDGSDEHGVLWNDPDLMVPWNAASPLVSERDSRNPRLRDVSQTSLPDYAS